MASCRGQEGDSGGKEGTHHRHVQLTGLSLSLSLPPPPLLLGVPATKVGTSVALRFF